MYYGVTLLLSWHLRKGCVIAAGCYCVRVTGGLCSRELLEVLGGL